MWVALLYILGTLLLPGCEGLEEDSTPMYWDAKACGNGIGTSFVAYDLGDGKALVITEDLEVIIEN